MRSVKLIPAKSAPVEGMITLVGIVDIVDQGKKIKVCNICIPEDKGSARSRLPISCVICGNYNGLQLVGEVFKCRDKCYEWCDTRR